MSIKNTKSTKRETSDFISFRCFYERKKMLLFLFACVRFMLFILVKFSHKKNKSLKLVLITSTNILLVILIGDFNVEVEESLSVYITYETS